MNRLNGGLSILAAAFTANGIIQRNVRHGHAMTGNHSMTYNSWQSMLGRCQNENNKNFPRYGGRGISVCERWQQFENFFADMGERPIGKTLDRTDVNGNYEPSNCKWSTPSEQSANTRRALVYSFDGETLPLIVWAERTGIGYSTLKNRIRNYGWSVERALTTPILIDRGIHAN